jgi:hypothetical protein
MPTSRSAGCDDLADSDFGDAEQHRADGIQEGGSSTFPMGERPGDHRSGMKSVDGGADTVCPRITVEEHQCLGEVPGAQQAPDEQRGPVGGRSERRRDGGWREKLGPAVHEPRRLDDGGQASPRVRLLRA